MSNLAMMDHLSFERGDSPEEIIVRLNLHGAPTTARMAHRTAILALGDLLFALDVKLPPPEAKPA